TSIVHAPQAPCSQRKWVPVNFNLLRKTSARLVRASMASDILRLLTTKFASIIALPLLQTHVGPQPNIFADRTILLCRARQAQHRPCLRQYLKDSTPQPCLSD